MFRQDFTCPALLEFLHAFYLYGAITHDARLSNLFQFLHTRHWPNPRSLATTSGVSVDVLSSGYLDVSVPRVRFYSPMYSRNKYLPVISVGPKIASSHEIAPIGRPIIRLPCPGPVRPKHAKQIISSEQRRSKVGFPIRKFSDQSPFAAPQDLSQRTTSFIASQHQGIHRTPFWHLIALVAETEISQSYPSQNSISTLKRPVLLPNTSRSPCGQARAHD